MSSYQYRDSHVKDKTVSPTVLSLTWESPYLGKTVFILRRGPDHKTISWPHCTLGLHWVHLEWPGCPLWPWHTWHYQNNVRVQYQDGVSEVWALSCWGAVTCRAPPGMFMSHEVCCIQTREIGSILMLSCGKVSNKWSTSCDLTALDKYLMIWINGRNVHLCIICFDYDL